MVESHSSSPSGKSRRGAGRGAINPYAGGDIIEGKRNRGGKKNYVVDSTEDDDDEIDAEGEDEDDHDADADGDIDMSTPVPTSRKALKPSPKGILKTTSRTQNDDDDDDDDELSDPNVETTNFGYESVDEDAEGEEDDDVDATVIGRGNGAEEDDDIDSDDDMDMSRGDPNDLSRMTKRQRARFADEDGLFMKLSDEVQVKKHFTAEELSMRRTEMARRRRNLSDKRNEEVKMETINKLLKKQPPKTNKRVKTAEEELWEAEARRPDPRMIRWVSSKVGITVSVPNQMLESPLNEAFKDTMKPSSSAPSKMIEEIA
ncbi:hypothetical protein Cpir12675_000739 [Ceratocystis pirilliformis]|uniref:INO80 complex subunit B-like conserved region domain-containing protein n=1 Tax=Ceratocystis pirilliformis TaxID=259994 RepID=A0ABR3ZJG7_9PEZI